MLTPIILHLNIVKGMPLHSFCGQPRGMYYTLEPVELFRPFQIDLAPALYLTLEGSFELELAQHAGEAREAIAKPCHVLNANGSENLQGEKPRLDGHLIRVNMGARTL